MATCAALPLLKEMLAPYELLREVGSGARSRYLVRHAAPGEKPKLLIAERFVGMGKPADARAAAFVGEARRISTLASSNLARVRELVVRGDDVIVLSDFIDGDMLVKTWLDGGMPLEVALRVILDVLAGVGVIHGLRDATQQPMQLAHGELSTATIVVGLDGAARVLHMIARRAPGAQTEGASRGYLAPEVHAEGPYGTAADVFSAGVLLWEALKGKRLFAEGDSGAILSRVRGDIAALADIPDRVLWAKGLVQVAATALAPLPDDRWPSAAAMAAEIRKVVGLRLASATTAAAFAKVAMGERVNARRKRFESEVALAAGALSANTAHPPPLGVATARASPGARLWADDDSRPGAPLSVPVPADSDVEIAPDSAPTPVPASPIPSPFDSRTENTVHVLTPPPLPERALPPASPVWVGVPPTARDEVIAAHASEISDISRSIASPMEDPFEVSPTSVERYGGVAADDRENRRRRVAVLGGVGALGLIVFALAGWRAAHPDGAHAALPDHGQSPHALAASGHVPGAPFPAVASIPAPAPTSPPGAGALPSGPATIATAMPPAVAVAAPRAPHSPGLANPPPAPKAFSGSAPARKSSTLASPRPKPRPTSGYDPNAL